MASLTPRALQILVLLAACDSTSPAPELQLQVEGQVLQAAQAPTPPLFVELKAWPELLLADTGSVVLETDAAGRYQAELGPFPDGLIDSLVVRVTQDDSVRGRWRLNHSASVGDDYGYFRGVLESGVLRLQLRPTVPTPCTGLLVDIPIGGDNGSIIEAASLAGMEAAQHRTPWCDSSI